MMLLLGTAFCGDRDNNKLHSQLTLLHNPQIQAISKKQLTYVFSVLYNLMDAC